jgi:polyphenol oxidase
VIAADQPTCFPPELLVHVSSKADGTMLNRLIDVHNPEIVAHRRVFCADNNINYDDVVYQRILFDDIQTYDSITEVNEHQTSAHVKEIHTDALVTNVPGVGLFLPVADCIATIIYDPTRQCLALLHLGRHSSVAQLMTKTLTHLQRQGTSPADCIVWMSPSVHQSQYKMEYFDHQADPAWRDYCDQREDGVYLDLQGYNTALAITSGVLPEHIHISSVNTATDDNYFSHSHGDLTGRFAVLAEIRK